MDLQLCISYKQLGIFRYFQYLWVHDIFFKQILVFIHCLGITSCFVGA